MKSRTMPKKHKGTTKVSLLLVTNIIQKYYLLFRRSSLRIFMVTKTLKILEKSKKHGGNEKNSDFLAVNLVVQKH